MVTPATDGAKAETPEELLSRTLNVSKWNPSLTLLYFHTPHEDVEKSKLTGSALATFKQCRAIHDEQVVRWLALYHPVEVDMGKSDAKTAARLGCKDGALFAVIDQNMNVLASSKGLERPEQVEAFLKTTLKSEVCKTYWTAVQAQIDEQRKTLDEARALAKQEKFKEAMEKYTLLLNSKVRVADFYDDAVKEATKVARKAEQAK